MFHWKSLHKFPNDRHLKEGSPLSKTRNRKKISWKFRDKRKIMCIKLWDILGGLQIIKMRSQKMILKECFSKKREFNKSRVASNFVEKYSGNTGWEHNGLNPSRNLVYSHAWSFSWCPRFFSDRYKHNRFIAIRDIKFFFQFIA